MKHVSIALFIALVLVQLATAADSPKAGAWEREKVRRDARARARRR